MGDLSRKTASIYINHAPAEEALKKLQADADKLTEKIRLGQAAGKGMVNEINKLSTAQEAIAKVQKQIDSGLRPSFNQLQTIVAKTRAELKKMSEDDAGFKQKTKDLNKYSTEMNRLGTQIGAVKKEGGGVKGALMDLLPVAGFAAAGAAVGAFLSDAVAEAMEAEKATARFQATLENVGKSASFERLQGKADAMAERFKFLDNDDIIGVFEKLITYGKLTEAQIDQLTPVIVNFAAKSKISVDESASVIIKALEGNGKALKEYGITIKDAKTESERFGIVTGELADKVNGAADAFGSTTQGKIAETEQTIKNLKEEIGTGLLPFMQKFYEGVNNLIGGIQAAFANVKDGWNFLFGGDNSAQKFAQNAAFAESIASDFGKNSIERQKQMNESYKQIYISSLNELKAFLNSSDSENQERRAKLTAALRQDKAIYLATQRTFQESIDQKKKNDDAAAKKEAEANAKKADETNKKAAEENKKAQEKADQLKAEQKRIEDEFRKKDLQAIENDQKAKANILKDQYRQEADDQTKSLDDRFTALKAFYAASQDLVQKQKDIDLKQLKEETDAALIKAKGSPEAIKQVQAFSTDQTTLINDTAAQNSAKIQQDFSKDTTKFAKAEFDKMVKAGQKAYKEIADAAERSHKDQVDHIEIDKDAKLLQLDKDLQGGKIKNLLDYTQQREKIEAAALLKRQLADLKELEFQQAMGNNSLEQQRKIDDLKVVISKSGVDQHTKDEDAKKEKAQKTANDILNVSSGVLDIISSVNALQDAHDEAQIEKNNQRQKEEQNKLQRQLNSKLLSQKEYDRQTKALDDKTRKENAVLKKKEFVRSQNAQVIEAIIAGARAVVSALATEPPMSFVFAGIAGAVALAQIAIIKGQKPPEFGKGGMLKGPTHSQGGMPVINPATGKKVAELEGGEPILSRKTYKNNKSLIDELLYSSMYGNGAPITPAWKTRRYQPVNYSGITKTIERVRMYESGGVFTPAGQTADTSSSRDPGAQLPYAELLDMINALRADINTPKKNYVLISDVNAASDTLDLIKRETTIKRA